MKIEQIDKCRICGNTKLIEILDLGIHALSGRFPAAHEQDPPKTPLVLVKCDDNNNQNCGLLQLKHNFSLDDLFREHYGYRSGLNKTMTTHLQNLVKEIESKVKLKEGDVVLDIGSNDATSLKAYSVPGIKRIGIDPTATQFRSHYTSDIALVEDFFNLANFKKVSDKKAKVITSIAMFYDLWAPMEFMKDVKDSLADDGIWVLEQSYMPLMLERNAFDTICHEHLEYYALKQFTWMAERLGLKIVDISFNDCNGGSFRVTMAHKNSSHAVNEKIIRETQEKELDLKLDTIEPYEDFKDRVEDIKKSLMRCLNDAKASGKSIYVYGASTKGNTLLQYFGVDTGLITAAAERNPEKFGRRTPGTHIPIISEEEARKAKPDYFIVLPWHFKKEFLEREKSFLESGGKFIFPMPEFEVVGNEYLTASASKQTPVKKKALITGITGQIGSYLAELLAEKGYEVYGIVRRTSLINSRERIDHIKGIKLLYGDLGDANSIEKIIAEVEPDEIYNLAAQSHVWISFTIPEHTADIGALGVLRILEAAKRLKKQPRIYQASTSELFGGLMDIPLNEEVQFHPRSPYGVAKLYGFWIMKNYREAYNMFCSNGILFNSESPRRGENFLTRKITKGIADIMRGKQETIHLGNLNAKRDWMHAKDAAQAIWMILQAEKAGDYVIASGESRSVREFAEIAFKEAGIDLIWKGEGLDEVGIDSKTGRTYIKVDPYYFRPAEVHTLLGDSSKLRKELGWKPMYSFDDLVQEMVAHDLQ